MSNSFQTGKVIPKKDRVEEEVCLHKNIVPSEYNYAKVSYPNGYKEPAFYDYTATALYANVLRVTKYFCLNCRKEIKGPKRLKD